jgi:hypothetical protein
MKTLRLLQIVAPQIAMADNDSQITKCQTAAITSVQRKHPAPSIKQNPRFSLNTRVGLLGLKT